MTKRNFYLGRSVIAILAVALSSPGGGDSCLAEDLKLELARYPHEIVYETYRDGNWELFALKADGSSMRNLTKTPRIHELSPHVSNDASKVSFVVDEGEGSAKVRNVYVMNLDGSGRALVAPNARQQCFNGDGSVLAYLKGESESFTYTDYATVGVFFFDLASGSHREHPNGDLHHLYNICRTADGKWLLATVHAGMGHRHAILAIEADGQNVYNLEIPGCRPDVSPDGTMVAWGASDWVLRAGELDFSGAKPAVKNIHDVVKSDKPMEVYHVDWSPDGKYVAFSRGPAGKRMGRIPELVGVRADGWNICVADSTTTNRWVQLTTDGNCNKEPDWIPQK